MEIRGYRTTDAPAVLAFIRRLREEGHRISLTEIRGPEDLKDWTGPFERIILAEEDAVVIGLARGRIGQGEKRHSAMLTAAILTESRGKGLAAILTDRLNQSLAQAGVLIVRAYIYSDNPASVKTIEKQGFTFAGRVAMHHFDESTRQYVDDLIYHKRIGKEQP